MDTDSKKIKKEKHMFLCKYWHLLLIFASIPLILSVCCYFSIPYFNQAGSAAWLSFWGGYLGSVIMAGITLYVLNRQLKQNHNENICNAVLQIATLTNNEEKAHIDKLSDALVDFQSSFDFLIIHQIVERMLNSQFLASDVNILNNLVRDIDYKGLKVDTLLMPISESEHIEKYKLIYNQLYNGYGLLIGDLISFIDLMKDLPSDEEKANLLILQEIKNAKSIEASMIPNPSSIAGFTKPKNIFEIIEENDYYKNITVNAHTIILERMNQSINDWQLKETLKGL